MALSPYDQQVYDAGFKFIPQTQYLQNPFVIPQDDTSTTDPNTGIATLPMGSGGGGGDGIRSYEQFTPDFNRRGVFADPKEYGPGGMYEVNPAALGFEFGPQGQVMRAGPGEDLQGQLGPTTTNPRLFGSSLDRAMFRVAGIPAREIADMYDARMQNIPGQGFRNFLKNFTGAQSNFKVARAPGTLQDIMGKIPSLTGILSAIGGNVDRSDTARYAVDDAGYGTGTQRDQFGVFTGGKTLLGKTANYTERMKNEIADIAKNFGYSEEDLLGLDPNTLAALGARNKFRQTQVIDYVNKLRAKDIETAYKDAVRKQEFIDSGRRDEVADLQNRIDRGDFDSTSSIPDRDRGNVTTASAAKTSKVGGGGYTKSDSARESRRGGQYGFMDGGIVDMLEIYD
tara:strand:- start:23 stop:1213 length:1191 start_codon:yes stop_codon:yes gene_type:complete